jgi:hypothetical protein
MTGAQNTSAQMVHKIWAEEAAEKLMLTKNPVLSGTKMVAEKTRLFRQTNQKSPGLKHYFLWQ